MNIFVQWISGKASGKGGEGEEDGKRTVGIPVEFPNVCEAMKYFGKNDNLNIKTQVVGIGVGSKRKLFPRQGRSYYSFYKIIMLQHWGMEMHPSF